ncbi:hypothetical protein YW7DRAFT_00845 [Streptomyces sp. AmelKG-E11A]|nr:hypothetical protein YW7DRAFT_00845 [Streptomyces sp. AmelKG-E11A]
MLVGAAAPTGPARRGTKPSVFPIAAIDDPVLLEALAELAAARADEMDADTVNRELSIARKAIGWWQRQGWARAGPGQRQGWARAGSKATRRSASSDGRRRPTAPRLSRRTRSQPCGASMSRCGRRPGGRCSTSPPHGPTRCCASTSKTSTRRTSAAGSPPRAERPSGSTGSQAPPPSCCPGSSPAVPAARCSPPTARPWPERDRGQVGWARGTGGAGESTDRPRPPVGRQPRRAHHPGPPLTATPLRHRSGPPLRAAPCTTRPTFPATRSRTELRTPRPARPDAR